MEPQPAPALRAHPVRRRSLPLEVADQLVELIASARTPELVLPGERELCSQLEVGRNALREALTALERVGVVEVRGKSRIGVVPRARTQLVASIPATGSGYDPVADPIEVRRILEPEAAALAAARADESAIAEIQRWLTLMEDGLAEGRRVVDYDAAFHVAVARATRNRTMVELIGALNDAVSTTREESFRPAGAAEQASSDHRAILDAIERRDEDAARHAMHAHLSRVELLVRASRDALSGS